MNRYVLPLHRIPLPGERLLHYGQPVEVVRLDHYTAMFTGSDTAVMEIRYLGADEDEPWAKNVLASSLSEELFGETMNYSGPMR